MQTKFVLEISEYGKLMRKVEDSNHKRFMEDAERTIMDHLRNHSRQMNGKDNEVKNIQIHLYTTT